MLDRDLPIAMLTGKDSVSLILQYGYYSDPSYADFHVELRTPNCTLAVDQDFSTSTYQLADPNKLTDLLSGESDEKFEIDATRFNMEISSLEFGIRKSYLVQLEFSTITPLSHAPWPTNETLTEYMLMNADSIGHLKFAFGCQETQLRDFQQQLAEMYRKTMAAIGG